MVFARRSYIINFFPFRGLRKTAEFDYEHSEIYHYVFTARFAFIVVFEVLHQKKFFFSSCTKIQIKYLPAFYLIFENRPCLCHPRYTNKSQ